MNRSFELPLKGVIPPMVTPLLSDGTLDVEGVHKIVEHLILGGVQGVFILGTTGESASLSMDMREKLIAETLGKAVGRIPVLVGITDSSAEVSLHLAAKASTLGASAVVAAPPYYYTLSQLELVEYYKNLADKLPLPLFLYNMPSHTKITFDLSTVLELSAHPNIVGLKDSSANSQYFQKLVYNLKDNRNFSLLVGPEEILAETVLLGGHGGVHGGANIFPELYVELYRAAVKRDFSKILPLQEIVMEISNDIYTVGSYQSSYLKGLKSSLEILGLCHNHLAAPLQSFNEPEHHKIKESIESIRDRISSQLTGH